MENQNAKDAYPFFTRMRTLAAWWLHTIEILTVVAAFQFLARKSGNSALIVIGYANYIAVMLYLASYLYRTTMYLIDLKTDHLSKGWQKVLSTAIPLGATMFFFGMLHVITGLIIPAINLLAENQ